MKRNLYLVQDTDRPMYVIAPTWAKALERWTELMATENHLEPEEVEPCQGIQLVCQDDELVEYKEP